jgi:hypothetical protein
MSVDPTKREGVPLNPLGEAAPATGRIVGRGTTPLDPSDPAVQQVISVSEILNLSAGSIPPLQTLKGKDDSAASMLETWVGTAEVCQGLQLESQQIAQGLEHFAAGRVEKGSVETAVAALEHTVVEALSRTTEPGAARKAAIESLPQVIKLLEKQAKAEGKGSLKGLSALDVRGLLARAQMNAGDQLGTFVEKLSQGEKVKLEEIDKNPLVRLFLLRETGHTNFALYYEMQKVPPSTGDLISLLSQAQALSGQEHTPGVEAALETIKRVLPEQTFKTTKDLQVALKSALEDPSNVGVLYKKYAVRMQEEARQALRMPIMLLTYAMQMQGRIMFKTSSGQAAKFAPQTVLEKIEKGESFGSFTRGAISMFLSLSGFKGIKLSSDTEEMIGNLVAGLTKPTYEEHCTSLGDEVHAKVAGVIRSLVKPVLEMLSGKAQEHIEKGQLEYEVLEQSDFAERVGAMFGMMQPKPQALSQFLKTL